MKAISMVVEMTFREAVAIYRDATGSQYHRVDKSMSYVRNAAWHLLSRDNHLLAVVSSESRSCIHGPALLAWSRQLRSPAAAVTTL